MEFSGVRTLGRLCRFLILVGCCLLDSAYSNFTPHPRFPSPSLFHSLSAMKLKSGRRPLSMELTTHHYMQTLDHFTFKPEGCRRFPQRYLVNNTYWGGPQTNSPIFVGLGAESDIISQLTDFGMITEHAAHFRALILFIEICRAITSQPPGTDPLTRLAAGAKYANGGSDCLDLIGSGNATPSGWDWQNIKKVLKHFGSNIIFSNGLRDSYSSGGVLENISKSIVAITTEEGVHCEDIMSTTSGDPKWLKRQRSKEITIIRGWIHGYEMSMTI